MMFIWIWQITKPKIQEAQIKIDINHTSNLKRDLDTDFGYWVNESDETRNSQVVWLNRRKHGIIDIALGVVFCI